MLCVRLSLSNHERLRRGNGYFRRGSDVLVCARRWMACPGRGDVARTTAYPCRNLSGTLKCVEAVMATEMPASRSCGRGATGFDLHPMRGPRGISSVSYRPEMSEDEPGTLRPAGRQQV